MENEKIRDYYRMLEIDPRASSEVIDVAYRALAQKLHLQPGILSLKDISEAHIILSDPKKRADYDLQRLNLSGLIVGERYRVLERFAEGKFSYLYRAEHIINKKIVCLKHCADIDPHQDEILLNGFDAVFDLTHWGIPTMRDIFRLDDGRLAIVMKYIPGLTLEQILERVGKLELKTACWIFARLLNILLYLHTHGVIHGNINPQKIIIRQEGMLHEVYLVGYGFAMVKPTRESKPLGLTLMYASPEQEKGLPLAPESDFYSLGLNFIKAVTGSDECVEKRLLPKDFPPALSEFVWKLIIKDFNERPNWRKVDLTQEIEQMEVEAFGEPIIHMEPIRGI